MAAVTGKAGPGELGSVTPTDGVETETLAGSPGTAGTAGTAGGGETSWQNISPSG